MTVVMSSSWLRHRQKQRQQQTHRQQRSASLPRLNQASKEDSAAGAALSECGGMAQLRIFNMRQPTNLTGRFPSTVALHAKVEELMIESKHKNAGQQQEPPTNSIKPAAAEILPNLVQPLSLLPDWR